MAVKRLLLSFRSAQEVLSSSGWEGAGQVEGPQKVPCSMMPNGNEGNMQRLVFNARVARHPCGMERRAHFTVFSLPGSNRERRNGIALKLIEMTRHGGNISR